MRNSAPSTVTIDIWNVTLYNTGMQTQSTVVDLFCGAGGFSHGFERAGWKVLGGVDFNQASIDTFQVNHPNAKARCMDLTGVTDLKVALELENVTVDCVAGGPPCQGFSIENIHLMHKDFDSRNYLFQSFVSLATQLQPKIIVMENVPTILNKQNGAFQLAIIQMFNRAGYNTNVKVLNAAEYGVPQSRKRAFFTAVRKDLAFEFPTPTHMPSQSPTNKHPEAMRRSELPLQKQESLIGMVDTIPYSPVVWDAIGDLHGVYGTEESPICKYAKQPTVTYQQNMRNGNSVVTNHIRHFPKSEKAKKRMALLSEGQGILHLPIELRTKSNRKAAYRRLQRNAVALTLTTAISHPASGMFTHPLEDRVITIREAARLQSFQDSFVFKGSYAEQCRQVGNSVAPLVAMHLAMAAADALDGLA